MSSNEASLPASPLSTPHDRPLAISLLLGASGWVAGLFMLAFIAMLFRPDEPAQAAICGLVLLAAAWGLYKVDSDGAQVFIAQLALAFSIAGQCLMLFALSGRAHSIVAIANAALVLQILLALVMPNRLHRTLSTVFACIAWALTVRFGLLGAPSFDWRGNMPRVTLSLAAAIAGWLVAWVPIIAALWWSIGHGATSALQRRPALVQPIVTGLTIGLAFATVASQPFESWRWLGGGEADVGGLALWPLLSAFGALAAVAAAYARRQRGLMSVCIVAALLHVSHFYFALGTSLLVKSVLMLAMGGIALIAARVVRPTETAP